jgi:hypothetical protein
MLCHRGLWLLAWESPWKSCTKELSTYSDHLGWNSAMDTCHKQWKRWWTLPYSLPIPTISHSLSCWKHFQAGAQLSIISIHTMGFEDKVFTLLNQHQRQMITRLYRLHLLLKANNLSKVKIHPFGPTRGSTLSSFSFDKIAVPTLIPSKRYSTSSKTPRKQSPKIARWSISLPLGGLLNWDRAHGLGVGDILYSPTYSQSLDSRTTYLT